MLIRNLLLVLGGLTLLAGLALSVVWLSQTSRGPTTEPPPTVQPAILVAARPIVTGTLLREEDIAWQDTVPTGIRPGYLARGQIQTTDFLGAVARRDFSAGEPLIASDLVKPHERGFLAAVLRPGTRAVSMSADASQSASGLILPGDHVDVILIQSFGDSVTDPARKLVGETVLVDVRAVAVDQSLNAATRATLPERRVGSPESQLPKTVTLELSPRQAEVLLVAGQLGRLGVSVRALQGSGLATVGSNEGTAPIWASDVSPALKELGRPPQSPFYTTGSSVEKSIRRVPPPGATFGAPVAAGETR
jgi:pilus assembly protein CpaB